MNKNIYNNEAKTTINYLKSELKKLFFDRDTEKFYNLYENNKADIEKYCVFLYREVSELFSFYIQNFYYKLIINFSNLLYTCGDRNFLHRLKLLGKKVNNNNLLENIEIYKIKKLILDLTNKYNKNTKLIFKLDIDIIKSRSDWLE